MFRVAGAPAVPAPLGYNALGPTTSQETRQGRRACDAVLYIDVIALALKADVSVFSSLSDTSHVVVIWCSFNAGALLEAPTDGLCTK